MENVKSFRQDSPRDKGFEKFGEHVTVDTMVLHGLGNRGNNGETDAVVFYDLATSWLEAVPVKGRTNSDTLRAFQQMFGRLEDVNAFSMDVERRYAPPEVGEIYCDKAREFISVRKRVGMSVADSTPGMPRTNAIVESKVKLVLHGARVALRQAGLSAKFWPYACRHFCHARNIELREGHCAYSAQFDGAEFEGMISDVLSISSRLRLERKPAAARKTMLSLAMAKSTLSRSQMMDWPRSRPDSTRMATSNGLMTATRPRRVMTLPSSHRINELGILAYE